MRSRLLTLPCQCGLQTAHKSQRCWLNPSVGLCRCNALTLKLAAGQQVSAKVTDVQPGLVHPRADFDSSVETLSPSAA